MAPLKRTAKVLGIMLDTHFTFCPHSCDCIDRTSKALMLLTPKAERAPLSSPETSWDRVSSKAPSTNSDDWGGESVRSQAPNKVLWVPSLLSRCLSRAVANLVLQKNPFSAALKLLHPASALPSFCRLSNNPA